MSMQMQDDKGNSIISNMSINKYKSEKDMKPWFCW